MPVNTLKSKYELLVRDTLGTFRDNDDNTGINAGLRSKS
jgi:hypothetical protein